MHSQSAWWQQTELHTSWRAKSIRVYRSQQLYAAEQWLSCKKRSGGTLSPSLFPLLFLLPLSPSLPCLEAAPWQPARGMGELCNFRTVGSAYTFWCILSSKIAPAGNIFFTNTLRKNNCIGKKCRNDVRKFTPTKNFRAEFRISGVEGGSFPRLYD